MAIDNNDFTHEFQIYSTDKNAGTMGTGKFLLFDDNINAVKVESIDNIKIGGGSNGRVLATDGEGNLYWMSAAAVTGGVSNYNDLNDLPDLSIYAQTSNLATVATSGSYNDLTNKPSLFSGSYTDLTNKPTLVTSYNQLTDKPTIPTVPTDVSAFTNDAGYLTSVTNITGNAATVSNGVYTNGSYANPAWITSLAYSKLTDAPDLATVATSGSYADLTNKPSLATVATTGSYSDLTNRPSIFSGSYTDLTNKPTLFDGAYLSLTGLPNLAAVATSGSYDDLSNKPSIPAAQVNADWNETISESPAFIFNKPSIPDLTGYATEAWVNAQGFGSGGAGVTSYNDLTDKPSIPSSLSDLGITAGLDGQVLTLNSSLTPVWATPSGSGASTGDITFDGIQIIGAETVRGGGSIELVPNNGTDYVTAGQYINIYPTNAQDAPHIHVDAGAGGDLILGNDNFNVDVNHNGDVRITAYDSADSTSYQWRFNNDGKLQLPTNGIIQQNGSFTRTTTPGINGATTNGVVWTSLYNDISSAKLTIQLETNEDGDTTGWHTQVCEAIIASRGAGTGGGGIGDPVMTVYGVTYTSTVPLATFTVQRDPITQLIEVVATRTAATVEGISFRINSVEMKTRD